MLALGMTTFSSGAPRRACRASVVAHAGKAPRSGAVDSPSSVVEKLKTFAKDITDNLSTNVDAYDSEGLIEELSDTSALGQRGELYVVAQFIFLGLVAFPLVDLEWAVRLSGLLAILLGVTVIVSGSSSLGKSLTPLPAPRKGAQLATSGMFKYFRHPLYSGLILASVGLAALTDSPTRLVFAAGLIVLLYYKSEYEERQLVQQFGQKYEDYQKRVKRFGVW